MFICTLNKTSKEENYSWCNALWYKIYFLHLGQLQEHLQDSPQQSSPHPGQVLQVSQVSETIKCHCQIHFQNNSKNRKIKWNLPGMMNLSFFQESETIKSKVRRWMADEEYFLALLFSESQAQLICVRDGKLKSLLHNVFGHMHTHL